MRILLVEDKIPLAKSLSKILRAHNYIVDLAFDGEEGLEMARANSYEVMVLDLGLPKIDGLEVLTILRGEKNLTPILILTARGQTSDIVTGLQEGADDYLPKPFEVEELIARIQALTRRTSQNKTGKITIDDLIFDESSGEVTRGGQAIALSKTEITLLSYLIRHSPRIISKNELLSQVWEDDGAIYDRVVDTYIYYLRQKIDKAFPKAVPLIHTIKTRGYKVALEK